MSNGLRLTFLLGALITVVGVGLHLLRPDTQEVTVYSSMPYYGPAGPQSHDMVDAMRLAWDEAGRKAGKFKVNFVPPDDSTRDAKGWAQRAVVTNALTAAEDPSTAVYIGEYDSGASAISIPILSRAKVPQISPSNTAVGLTTSDLGANVGEPDKYYAARCAARYAGPPKRDRYLLDRPERRHDAGRLRPVHDRAGRLAGLPAPDPDGRIALPVVRSDGRA
jgi:hypothetical protein